MRSATAKSLKPESNPESNPASDPAQQPASGQAQSPAHGANVWQRPVNFDQLEAPPNGTRRQCEQIEYVFYHGYWVRYYPPRDESLASRKTLIDHLTRRAFHHTEAGINTPGDRLELARVAYEAETDLACKRVNAAMLAGALFNRATDIFTAIVDLEAKGVTVSRDNELMRACSACFKEALELGSNVRHFSGEEGIDELWGEPFRAFALPVESYYESRYIKVAQTMANIDLLANTMIETFGNRPEFHNLPVLIEEYATAAKVECETMKKDDLIFRIWPRFVADGERIDAYMPHMQPNCSRECQYVMEHAMQTLVAGRKLVSWVARARVPMPQSTQDFLQLCRELQDRLAVC